MKRIDDISLKNISQAKQALFRMFPSRVHYFKFKNEDSVISSKAIPHFIKYAYELGLMHQDSEENFIDFINDISMEFGHHQSHTDLNFSEIMDEIKGKTSINRLVDRLQTIALLFNMPDIQASMITRMKKNFRPNTPKKRALLRVIAFWLGYHKPQYFWNYQTLVDLKQEIETVESRIEEDEGVRIDFSFQGRGEIIDFKMIDWLRKEIVQCIQDLKFNHFKNIEIQFYSTTTASLEIPKKSGPTGEPRLYDSAIRDGIAISHQILVRWSLSDIKKERSDIIIGIAAGKFSILSVLLKTILDVQIPGISSVRVTDFAKICARLTDVKAIFDEDPVVVRLPNNAVLKVWVIKHFWFLYYDLIPSLLTDNMLPATEKLYQHFKNELEFPIEIESTNRNHNALSVIRRYPQNDILSIEIAKVLTARKMFVEANMILSNVIALDPYHVVARSFRLLLLLNLAMEQADYGLFLQFFDQAVEEGKIIENYCDKDEDYFCEVALIYFSNVLYMIKIFMGTRMVDDEHESKISIKNILLNIKKSEKWFQKGLAFSPTGHRSIFWIVHLRSLYKIIESKKDNISKVSIWEDTLGAYTKISTKYFIGLGWLEGDYLYTKDIEIQIKRLESLFKRTDASIWTYYNAVPSRTYRPNAAYSIASVLWDFSPILTVGMAKLVLEWLERARDDAKELIQDQLGIYSINAWYSQIQSPQHFILCVNKSIGEIKNIIKEDLDQDDYHPIDPRSTKGLKLMLMHFNEDIKPGILVKPDDG